MKLTKNEIDILHWHLRRYIRAHQPDHPREEDHFNRFYKLDKLIAICDLLEEERKIYDHKKENSLHSFYKQRGD